MTVPEPTKSQSWRPACLAGLLRVLGAIDLCALVVVLLPWDWLAWCQTMTGMNSLPPDPIVGYLIRSTCTLYALHGALLIVLSFDVWRYRPLIHALGWLAVIHGIILWFVDGQLGMPAWWRWTEGPGFVLIGVAILWLSPRSPAEQAPGPND